VLGVSVAQIHQYPWQLMNTSKRPESELLPSDDKKQGKFLVESSYGKGMMLPSFFRNIRTISGIEPLPAVLFGAAVSVAALIWSIQMHNLDSFHREVVKWEYEVPSSNLTPKEKADQRKDLISLKKDEANARNSIHASFVQNLGGMFFLVTAYFTWRNLKLSEEKQLEERSAREHDLKLADKKQFTDRLARAFENLDSESSSLKLGAIYTLRRLASELSVEHQFIERQSIIDIIRVFIKRNSSSSQLSPIELRTALMVLAELSINDIQAQKTSRWSEFYLVGASLNNLDLSGLNFDKSNLSASDLDGATLVRTSLKDTDLSKAYLGKSDFSGSDLSKAVLREANIHNSPVKEVNFSESVLYKSDFTKAQLFRANFSRADLSSANMISAELREAKFHEAILNSTNFNDADLSKADLHGASMIGTILNGADLNQANLTGIKISNVEILKKAKNWESAIYDEPVRKQLNLNV
jgi:uncharacterized protein YjbI with pentapeptide repeats